MPGGETSTYGEGLPQGNKTQEATDSCGLKAEGKESGQSSLQGTTSIYMCSPRGL